MWLLTEPECALQSHKPASWSSRVSVIHFQYPLNQLLFFVSIVSSADVQPTYSNLDFVEHNHTQCFKFPHVVCSRQLSGFSCRSYRAYTRLSSLHPFFVLQVDIIWEWICGMQHVRSTIPTTAALMYVSVDVFMKAKLQKVHLTYVAIISTICIAK